MTLCRFHHLFYCFPQRFKKILILKRWGEMKKQIFVDRWEDMKLLLSNGRKEVLDKCIDAPNSIQDLAQRLGLNPSSIHNHVKKLHAAGFLKISETRSVNGIIEKKYRATAIDFSLSPRLKAARTESMNNDMAKAIHKETLMILGKGELGHIKQHRVSLSESNLKKARSMLSDLEKFLLENHETGELIASFVFVDGILNRENE